MATAPQIALPNGTGFVTNLVYTTNSQAIFITGTVGNNTAAIQISVNGGPFVSDPTLILLTLDNFTIPNPSNYPSGLILNVGENTIQIRTIDIVGGVSPVSTVTVTYITNIVAPLTQIPSGILVQQTRNYVNLLVAVPAIPTNQGPVPQFLGYNFYASTAPGGTTGYFLCNSSPITTASTQYDRTNYVTTPFGTTWPAPGGAASAIRVRITMVDEFDNELATQLDQQIPVQGYSAQFQVTGQFQNYALTNYIIFTHDRTGALPGTINSEQWASVANNAPLYYVVTGLYFDPATNSRIETPYSQEVLGTPLVIDTAIKDLPNRTQLQITLAYVQAITAVNTEISLIPGSTTRDGLNRPVRYSPPVDQAG